MALRSLSMLAWVVAASIAAAADVPTAPAAGNAGTGPRRVIVRVAELHLGDGRVLAPGALLIEAGRVKAFGTGLETPEGAEIWDEPAAILTPWLVDPAVRVPLAGNEGGRPESVLLSAADARQPWDPWIATLRDHGVRAVALVPSASSGFLGRSAVIGIEGPGAGGTPILAAPAQLVFAHPRATGSAAAAAVRQGLARALEDAERYARERKEWKDAHPKAGAGRSRASTRRDPGKPRTGEAEQEPRLDASSEVLVAVLEKRLPLRIEADRVGDVAAALELARERGLSVTLAGCRGCGPLAELIGQSQASVVLEPLLESAREVDGLPLDDDLPSALSRAGARLAVSAAGPWPSGPAWLRVAASHLARRGLPRAVAIAAMTGEAARACGAPDPFLVEGAPARFLLWDGDPLDPRSSITRHVEPAELGATKGPAAAKDTP